MTLLGKILAVQPVALHFNPIWGIVCPLHSSLLGKATSLTVLCCGIRVLLQLA
jgi:hypothetical protein